MSMKSRFGLGLNLVAEWPEASITLLSGLFYEVSSPKRNREAALRATDFTKELGGEHEFCTQEWVRAVGTMTP